MNKLKTNIILFSVTTFIGNHISIIFLFMFNFEFQDDFNPITKYVYYYSIL